MTSMNKNSTIFHLDDIDYVLADWINDWETEWGSGDFWQMTISPKTYKKEYIGEVCSSCGRAAIEFDKEIIAYSWREAIELGWLVPAAETQYATI